MIYKINQLTEELETVLEESKKSRKKRTTKRGKRKATKKLAGGYLTITTGFPYLNDERFNTAMGTEDIEDAADSINDALSGGIDGGNDSGSDAGDGGFDGGGDGGGMGESLTSAAKLTEAKREVKRYYIRPQNIYCANKDDILKALITLDGANCSVYTLNDLEDNNDIHKLTTADIIYYYDDGILYDKNHVKVMDYDLAVRKEEQRKRFTGTDLDFDREEVQDEYEDRLTEAVFSELEVFNQDFLSVTARGELLVEESAPPKEYTCCICGERTSGYGNNPAPVSEIGKCCDDCNVRFVLPARMAEAEAANKAQKH